MKDDDIHSSWPIGYFHTDGRWLCFSHPIEDHGDRFEYVIPETGIVRAYALFDKTGLYGNRLSEARETLLYAGGTVEVFISSLSAIKTLCDLMRHNPVVHLKDDSLVSAISLGNPMLRTYHHGNIFDER